MDNDITITVGKEELRDILQVSSNTLNSIIKRDTLHTRLLEVGYKLISIYKEGRHKAYDLGLINVSEWDRLQTKYKVKKKEEHTEYTLVRLYNLELPRAKLLRDNNIDISNTTAGRYDNILIEENAMQEDKQVYYKTNKDGLWEEISETYYKTFWTECREYKYIVSTYRHRLNKKEITQDVYDLVISNLHDTIERFKGYMVVRFKTYKEAENTKKILEIINNKEFKNN